MICIFIHHYFPLENITLNFIGSYNFEHRSDLKGTFKVQQLTYYHTIYHLISLSVQAHLMTMNIDMTPVCPVMIIDQ